MPASPSDPEQPAPHAPVETPAADGPPRAPGESPPVEAGCGGVPSDRLQRFIDFYLKPIAAGGLPAELGPTPLLVAFDIYDVADALRADGDATRRRLEAAVEEAARTPPPPLDPDGLRVAWNDLRESAGRVKQERFVKINNWLFDQARRCGLDRADLLHRPAEAGGTDWNHEQSVEEFYRFFSRPDRPFRRKPAGAPEPFPVPPAASPVEESRGEPRHEIPDVSPRAAAPPASPVDAAAAPTSSPTAIIILLTGSPPPAPADTVAASSPAAPPATAAAASTRGAARALPPPLPLPWSPVTFECPPAYYVSFEADVLEPLRRGAGSIVEGVGALLDGARSFAGDGPPAEGLIGMAFDAERTGPAHQAVAVRAPLVPGEDIWFVGDLHGDLLALECALRYVADRARAGGGAPWRVVFLGDLFDDGRYSYEVVLKVLALILRDPSRVCLLAGNHDEGLNYDPASGRFVSSVNPSDFTDELNARPDDAVRHALGRLAVRLFRSAPRALFLPDGLLVAHGGVPHADRLDDVRRRGAAALNDGPCLQDFVWTRAAERARRRIPNRATRGCEFGYEDFNDFCEAAAAAIGQPVRRMIRGHDHLENRYALFEKYQKHRALTINTLSCRLPREVFGPYERVPVVARWKADQVPEVHRLVIPPEVIRRIYPQPVAAE